MRWLPFIVVLVASVAHAAPGSNPTFLGVGMKPSPSGDVCIIDNVMSCSPAKDAGFREGDVVIAMDGKPIQEARRDPCDVMRERILSRAPGEVATYDVRRGMGKLEIKPTLATRADVQHRCLVGEKLPTFDAVDFDNPKRSIDLAETRGRTTIVGWFDITHCSGCDKVFDAIADGLRDRFHDRDKQPAMFGVTPREFMDPTRVPTRAGFTSTVQLALIDPDDFGAMSFREPGRMQIMIVDCRRVIRFIAPIAPGSDDVGAAVDEIMAAVEQTEHLRTQRR